MNHYDGIVLIRFNGQPVGMGILIDKKYIFTCGHVVNCAIDRPKGCRDSLNGETIVDIAYPMSDSVGGKRSEVLQCIVRKWIPPAASTVDQTWEDDCALLELVQRPRRTLVARAWFRLLELMKPSPVRPCRFTDQIEPSTVSEDVQVYAATSKDFRGTWALAKLGGRVGGGLFQVHVLPTSKILPGFSGAAVYSLIMKATLGATVMAGVNENRHSLFVSSIQIDQLLRMWKVRRLKWVVRTPISILRLSAVIGVLVICLLAAITAHGSVNGVVPGAILIALLGLFVTLGVVVGNEYR